MAFGFQRIATKADLFAESFQQAKFQAWWRDALKENPLRQKHAAMNEDFPRA